MSVSWNAAFACLSVLHAHTDKLGRVVDIGVVLTQLNSTLYTVSQKNDNDIVHYNFNAYQPILVIFGRDVAERICYQMVICHPTSPN